MIHSTIMIKEMYLDEWIWINWVPLRGSLNVIKDIGLPTFSPVTKDGRMSIFCSSLPNTWMVNHI